MLHICPESYAFLTLPDEWLDSVLLDLILAIEAELLLYLELYRKSVCVPTGLSRYILTLHGLVSGDHILDNTCKNVSNVGLAVCRRRSVIESIGRASFALLNTLLKDPIVFPELLYFLFAFHEIKVSGYFTVLHFRFSSLYPDPFLVRSGYLITPF